MPQTYGRCIQKNDTQIWIQNLAGVTTRSFQKSVLDSVQLGDLIEADGEHCKVLTRHQRPHGAKSALSQRILHPRRQNLMKQRRIIEAGIRDFFSRREFIETRTPALVPCPGMEPHIPPFQVSSWDRRSLSPNRSLFLPTSPEFAMKRLLVGGLERIFQICSAFRDEPHSLTHSPEFTLLEWYRAYEDEESIQSDTESLIATLATTLYGKPIISYQGKEISVAPPWPRLKVRDLFRQHVGIDLVECAEAPLFRLQCDRLKIQSSAEDSWDDLYFRIWLNLIEPKLPGDQAVFVTRYPASQAALAVITQDEDGSRWAKRFEAYAGGLELCNAFEELTDPIEQRRRFVEDMNLRERAYGEAFPKSPLDEGFLAALEEGMPPSSGNALGVDRLVMLLCDETDIDLTLWLPSAAPKLS